MSHVMKTGLQFNSLEMLEATVAQIPGAKFNKGKTTHRYYSGQKACEHEIAVDGINYSIGVIKHESGVGYDLALDDFGHTKGQHDGGLLVAHFGGKVLPAIKQGYTAQVSTQQLRKEGWRVFLDRQANGDMRVRATK